MPVSVFFAELLDLRIEVGEVFLEESIQLDAKPFLTLAIVSHRIVVVHRDQRPRRVAFQEPGRIRLVVVGVGLIRVDFQVAESVHKNDQLTLSMRAHISIVCSDFVFGRMTDPTGSWHLPRFVDLIVEHSPSQSFSGIRTFHNLESLRDHCQLYVDFFRDRHRPSDQGGQQQRRGEPHFVYRTGEKSYRALHTSSLCCLRLSSSISVRAQSKLNYQLQLYAYLRSCSTDSPANSYSRKLSTGNHRLNGRTAFDQ